MNPRPSLTQPLVGYGNWKGYREMSTNQQPQGRYSLRRVSFAPGLSSSNSSGSCSVIPALPLPLEMGLPAS